MKNKSIFTKILAIAGTVMVVYPFILILIAVVGSMSDPNLYYYIGIITGSSFWVVFFGAGFLLWAGFRARRRQKLIASGCIALVLVLVAPFVVTLVFPVLTFPSSEAFPSGDVEPLAVNVVGIIQILAYILTIMELVLAGGFLVGDLFKHEK